MNAPSPGSPLFNKIALLTGAGSGIGRCLANELAQQGAKLILTDLKEESLKETISMYGIEDSIIGLITTNFLDEDAAEQTVMEALILSPQIDVFYFNAGMMIMGQLINLSWEDIQKLQSVNLNTPMRMTHKLLPHMIENGGGYICYTVSSSAITTPPGASAYGMTKAGLGAFAEALRAEVHQHGVSVTSICPGMVHTPLMQNASYRDKKTAERTASVPKFIGSTPEKVARIAVKSMIKKRGMVLIGVDEKIKRFLKMHIPWLYHQFNLMMTKLILDK